MPQTASQVIANSGFPGPGIVALVDGNNNVIDPALINDTAVSGNLTSASGAGSTVVLQLGNGQVTWEAQLTGTFSSGTTIAFQGSDDASSPTNWDTAVGYDSSLSTPPPITSISGPGPFVIRGARAGFTFIQMICTALHSGDSITVRLIASTGALAGGGPVSIPDGLNVTLGQKSDTAVTDPTLTASEIAILKGLLTENVAINTNTADLVADLDTLITNTTAIATQATLLSAKNDLDTIVTNTADLLADGDHLAAIDTATADLVADLDTLITNTTGIATQATLAAVKTDLDTLAANTNTDNVVLLASGVVTSNGASSDITNGRCRGVKVYITTGAFGSGASAITVTIQGKDPVSNKYYNILTSASLVASKDISNAAANLLTVYPELAAVSNQTAQDVLPPTWRISYQAPAWGTGGSTLGIACAMIV